MSTGNPQRSASKLDTDAVADNVQSLVNVYNNMIQLGHNYHGSQESGKLLHDMESVAKSYFNELESIGLNLQQDGSIQIDKNLLTDAVSAPDARRKFSYPETISKTVFNTKPPRLPSTRSAMSAKS